MRNVLEEVRGCMCGVQVIDVSADKPPKPYNPLESPVLRAIGYYRTPEDIAEEVAVLRKKIEVLEMQRQTPCPIKEYVCDTDETDRLLRQMRALRAREQASKRPWPKPKNKMRWP